MKKVKTAHKTASKTAAKPANGKPALSPDDTPAISFTASDNPRKNCSHCHGAGTNLRALEFNFQRSGDWRGLLTELARLVGKSETMLSLVMSGKKLPPVMVLVRLADVLSKHLGERVTVDHILRSPAIAAKIRSEQIKTAVRAAIAE